MPFIVSGRFMQVTDENNLCIRIVMSFSRLRKTMKANLLFFLCIIPVVLLQASNPDSIIIRSIEQKALTLYQNNPDSVKKAANDSILSEMQSLLKTTSSLSFPFDSLRFVKVASPPDHSFILITWTVPYVDGHNYYGFIQRISKNEIAEVHELTDNGGSREPGRNYPATHWPGAVYYKLIEKSTKTGRLFTLFGWVGGEPGTARRVIEVLTFDEADKPVFGAPVFLLEQDELHYRVNFEYTDQVPFHLAYEEQFIPGRRSKKDRMIVFNRLRGNDPAMGRYFRAAVPSYNTFDALIFENGYWKLHKDIDARAMEISTPERSNRR